MNFHLLLAFLNMRTTQQKLKRNFVLSNTLDKKHRSLAIPFANFNTEGRNIIMGLEDYCQQNETLDCCVTVSFFFGGGGYMWSLWNN